MEENRIEEQPMTTQPRKRTWSVRNLARAIALGIVAVVGTVVILIGFTGLNSLYNTGDYNPTGTPNPVWTFAVLMALLGIVLIAIAGFGLSYRPRS